MTEPEALRAFVDEKGLHKCAQALKESGWQLVLVCDEQGTPLELRPMRVPVPRTTCVEDLSEEDRALLRRVEAL